MVVYEEKYFEDISDLKDICWSGAQDRLEEVEELGEEKQEQFINYIKENLESSDEILTTTQLNDFIWFECDEFIESLKEK